MLAPVETMASTMLQRIMSRMMPFCPAEMRLPASVRMMPQDSSATISSTILAARARLRAWNAVFSIMSIMGTTLTVLMS